MEIQKERYFISIFDWPKRMPIYFVDTPPISTFSELCKSSDNSTMFDDTHRMPLLCKKRKLVVFPQNK